MGAYDRMDNISRGLAFRIIAVFFLGTLVGSLLPETGVIAAHYLQIPEASAHIFNPIFLAFGVLGVCLALYIGYRCRFHGS